MRTMTVALMLVLLSMMQACHHAVVHTGMHGPYVSTGISTHVDGDAGAILALSLIGAMVGGAIYEETHAYQMQGLSAIDVNIQPDHAEISLDGVVMGLADDYDGFPQFMVVDPGTHTVRARCDGYQNYEVTIRVGPGEQINLNKRMDPGESGNEVQEMPLESDPQPAELTEPSYIRLVLTVNDPQASVYVDGAFVGTGKELSMLHSPLLLESDAVQLVVVTADDRQQFDIQELKRKAVDGVIRLDVRIALNPS